MLSLLIIKQHFLIYRHLFSSFKKHVEQLLRTLNLNSPAPYAVKKPQLNLDLNQNLSDFSPASVSSGLLTPTDLSPARAQFDKSPDASSALSTTPSSSLLFEQHAAQVKLAENLEAAAAANFRYGLPRSSSSNVSLFQPFSEQSTPASFNHNHSYNNLNGFFPNTSSSSSSSSLSQSIYSSPLPRRVDANRLPQMDWRLTQQPISQQSLVLGSDWQLPTEKSVLDFNLNQVDHAEPARMVIAHQPPPPPQPAQQAQDVSFHYALAHFLGNKKSHNRHSQLTFYRSSTLRLRLLTISSFRVSSSRPTSKRLSSFSNSLR